MKLDEMLLRNIMQTITRDMIRNGYCCGCYYDESMHCIICHCVKDNYYRMTRYFNVAWITNDEKWNKILEAISYFINDTHNAFNSYIKQHFIEDWR